MAELGAFFGNPNVQRQGARARALAAQRDVNTLPDPLTYAVVQGLLGTRPDEMGFSVLNPDYEKIRKAAEPAFALGLLGQAAPALAPLTKGLPVGATIKNVGTKLRVKPPTDNVYEVMDASFEFGKLGGNKTLPIEELSGGVRMTDPKEVKRVKELADKISSPDGYVSRIIVDDLGNVLEGQHRLEALRLLGEKNVPVAVIQDLSNKYDIPAMKKALEGKFRSDETRQLLRHSIDTLEEAGSIDKALSDFAMPARYQKPFEDAIKASKVKSSYPQQEALDTAQRNAALPVEEGGLGLPKNNTPEMRADASGLSDAYHGSKQDITGLFRAGYDDNLAFATKDPEFASKWIGKGKLNQRIGAEDEIKAAEDLYRQIKYRNTDQDLLSRLEGEEFNTAYDKMSAAARAEQEKEFGLRGNATGLFDTVYPLKIQANKTFNPETDMDVMKDFFVANDIPPKLQDLYAGGNYMMYETKPVVNYLKGKGYDSMRLRESTGDNYPTIAVFNPETVRSRNAAFDPFRRDTETALARGVAPPDLLAGMLPLGLLADEEQRKKLYELMPSLLGE
jgi:hypothetical protein